MSIKFNHLYANGILPSSRPKQVSRGTYDFAVAYPDPKSFPTDEIISSLKDAIKANPDYLAIYPPQQGNALLRDYISHKIGRDRSIKVNSDQIILGNGSGQSIDMICSVLLNAGDAVITDQYVYGGTLNTLRRHSAKIIGVNSDSDGMDPENLSHTISRLSQQGTPPKFVYLIPTFQNPQGWTLSLHRRQEILKVCNQFGVPILEDDCYFDNRYEGEPVTSIYDLDQENSVIYVGSFSKTIAPGMSVGFMTGPNEFLDRAMFVKSGRVSEFAAMAVYQYSVNYLDQHISEINEIQKNKRDAMLSALGENFGNKAKWSHPEGGLYIWVEFDDQVDITELHQNSVNDIDVGFHPGTNYSPDGKDGKHFIRLCYGFNQPDEIKEGISKLADYFAKKGVI